MSPRFDLRHIRYFVVVAEELNFRRAAERLHITQPPLSRQIRELEVAFQLQLFIRSTQGVTLTAAGAALLPQAHALLESAYALQDWANQIRGGTTLRIGVSVAISPKQLQSLEGLWALHHPVETVGGGYSSILIEQLRAGKFDAVIAGLPADVEGLARVTLRKEGLAIVLPRQHRAARKRVVSLHDVTDLPLFWWERKHNPSYFDHCQSVFRRLQYQPRMIYVQPAQLTTLERIARGEGCTLMNLSRRKTRIPGLVFRELVESPRLQIELAMLWPQDKQDALLEKLADAAKGLLSLAE
jgi:DNA-binding transcriptional LysR family regulator